MVVPSAAKSRRYSNATWRADRHATKDCRFQGHQPITYLGDASGCAVGAAAFGEAASENAVAVLQNGIVGFGTPATIL